MGVLWKEQGSLRWPGLFWGLRLGTLSPPHPCASEAAKAWGVGHWHGQAVTKPKPLVSGVGSIRGSLQGPKSFLADQGALEPHSVGPSFGKK